MKRFVLVIVGILCSFHVAQADTFEIHLQYDTHNDRLQIMETDNAVTINRDKNISIIEFSETPSGGQFEFVFLDKPGDVLESKAFSPQSGEFILETPYYSTATTLLIRRSGSSDAFITKDILSLSACNNNSVCEFEKGENINTCLPDCASGHVMYSPETQTTLHASGDVLRDPKTGDILLNNIQKETPINTTPMQDTKTSLTMVLLASFFGVLALGGAVYFIYKKW